MRVKTENEARELLVEHFENHVGGSGDALKMVWWLGEDPNATYYFRQLTPGRERSLWQVGPRGGIHRLWRLEDWQWEALR